MLGPLLLSRAGEARDDQPGRHRDDEIDEHREGEGRQHDHDVVAPEAVEPGEDVPVDQVPADLDEDGGQRGEGNRLDV